MVVRFDSRFTPAAKTSSGKPNAGHRVKTLIKSGRQVTFASGRTAIFKNK